MKEQLGIARSLLTYYAIPGRLRRLRRFYSQFIQPNDLCFDIGAHVGNRMLPWSRLGANIVAVEPQPSMMKLLRRFYGRSPHITLVEKAIGASSGTATLHISSRFPTVTTLSKEWITAVQDDASFAKVTWDKTMEVEIITLDSLIEQFGTPALCKIDIEGYELDGLKGLSTPIQLISFEYISATMQRTEACIKQLTTLGNYEFNTSTGERYQFNHAWLSPEEMIARLNQLSETTQSGDVYARWRGARDEER